MPGRRDDARGAPRRDAPRDLAASRGRGRTSPARRRRRADRRRGRCRGDRCRAPGRAIAERSEGASARRGARSRCSRRAGRGGEGAVRLGRGLIFASSRQTSRIWLARRGARGGTRRGGGSRLRSVAPEDGADERAAEGQRRLDDVDERERRKGGRCTRLDFVAERGRAMGARRRDVGRRGGGRGCRRPLRAPARLTVLAGLEGAAHELEHALGEEERVRVAEVDLAAADHGAHPPAEEEAVEVGALDAGSASSRRRALAHREVGGEGDGRVALELEGHRRTSAGTSSSVRRCARARRGRGGPPSSLSAARSRRRARASAARTRRRRRAHLLEEDPAS